MSRPVSRSVKRKASTIDPKVGWLVLPEKRIHRWHLRHRPRFGGGQNGCARNAPGVMRVEMDF